MVLQESEHGNTLWIIHKMFPNTLGCLEVIMVMNNVRGLSGNRKTIKQGDKHENKSPSVTRSGILSLLLRRITQKSSAWDEWCSALGIL